MTEITHDERPTLVLGGTGKTGRRVVQRLTARGLPVRVGSRPGSHRSTGTTVDLGAGAAGRRGGIHLVLPRHRHPGRGEDDPRLRRSRRGAGRRTAGAAVRARRGSGAAGRACGAGDRRRVDDRALRLVHAELQRGLPPGVDPRRRGRAAGRRQLEPFIDADDIADVAVAALTETRPRRAGVRADRPAVVDLRRSGRRDRQGGATGRSATSRCRSRTTQPRRRPGIPEEIVGFLTYLFSEVSRNNAVRHRRRPAGAGPASPRLRRLRAQTAATGVWTPQRRADR